MEIECWSIKGALIANILHGIYAVYDDTKNGPPLKRVPTAAAAATANYEEKEVELKDSMNKKKYQRLINSIGTVLFAVHVAIQQWKFLCL